MRDAKGGKATAMLAPVAPTHSWPIEFYVASLGLASGGKRTTSVVNLPTADSGDGTGGAWPHVSFPNLACDGAYDVWVMTCNKVGCSDKAHVAPFECDDFAAPPPPPPLPAAALGCGLGAGGSLFAALAALALESLFGDFCGLSGDLVGGLGGSALGLAGLDFSGLGAAGALSLAGFLLGGAAAALGAAADGTSSALRF